MKAWIIKETNPFRERNMKPNYSKLALENGVDRRTVKKYFLNPSAERKPREYRSAFDDYQSLIEQKLSAPGNTLAGVYYYLVNEKGLSPAGASYGAFTAFCRKRGLRPTDPGRRVHVRFETPPGRQVQVDWKEDIRLATRYGEVLEFNVFTATLGFSRKHVMIYSRSKTEQDFIRCVNEMLARYGGATSEILTDNMSAIVSISGQGPTGRRKKHPAIVQWETDSDIKIKLCKPRSPETKGKDESSNRFLSRLMAYDGEIEGEDDVVAAIAKIQNDANEKVNAEIGMPPESLFRMKEKQALRPLPNMSLLQSFADGGMTQKVPNTLLVPFLGCGYSVPPEYLGKKVRVLRNGDSVEIYFSKTLVASHPYLPGKKINYREQDYVSGLVASIGRGADGLEELARENLRRFCND